jgi:hypothetical protein
VRYRFDEDAMAGKTPSFLFLREGKAGVISLVTYDGKRGKLQTNGIQESYLDLAGGLDRPMVETLLGVMPYLLHPDPKTSFVVGYGGGATVEALAAAPLEKIHVVELEPAVVEAVRTISGGEVPVLQDPRVRLSFNDARNSLLVERITYDIIVSQPSHPWMAGAGNLFTRRFFEIVKSRLNDEGIFSQWVNLFNMDATTLRAILQAFYGVFPHGFTFADDSTGDLLLFGSERPVLFDYATMKQRMAAPEIKKLLVRWRIEQPEALLWYFAVSRDEALQAAGDMAPNTDTRILSEVRLAGLTSDPKGNESPYLLLKNHFHLDVLPYLNLPDAAAMLYPAGQYFLKRGSPQRARMTVEQLTKVNPELARRLAKILRINPAHRGKGTR